MPNYVNQWSYYSTDFFFERVRPMIKVLVCGAGGKMGREVVKAVHNDEELELVGGVDLAEAGKDVGIVAGLPALDKILYDSLHEAIIKEKPHVVVDFTNPSVVFENAKTALQAGVHLVIGTTGLKEEERDKLQALGNANGAHILVAPNFSLGAVMMMKVAAELAPYFPDVEIIELHHNHKYDAPSGTAARTALLINEARQGAQVKGQEDLTKESAMGARGAKINDISVHSVRLPGYVAHQEILFGGHSELLTIRHDSLHRESFMPGVILACKRIANHPGLTFGLEHYL